jgi:hypothetical protein
MECPRCGYILQPFESHCPRCAAQPPPARAVRQPDEVVMPPGTVAGFPNEPCKICRACGQPAVLLMDVCRRCGHPFLPLAAPQGGPLPPATGRYAPASIEAASRASAASHERRQVAILAAACLLVLALCVGAGFSLTSRPPHNSDAVSAQSGSGSAGAGSMFGAVDSRQMSSRLVSRGATVGGDLEFSLAWNGLSDLDLQVVEPAGAQVDAAHPRSTGGGVQDVDANPTLLTFAGERRVMAGEPPGADTVIPLPDLLVDLDTRAELPGGVSGFNLPSEGKAPGHWTRQPIEHTYFATAAKGVYTVRAHCYSWREPNASPLPFTVEIRSLGKVVYRTVGTIGPANYVADGAPAIEVCRFENR